MPRPSAASLAVAPVTALPSRLEPPAGFPEAESALWRSVVATKPIEWFQKDSAPILAEYCRAVVMCDRLAEALDGPIGEDFHVLLVSRDREAKRAAQLAVKMRLTQQSRYTPMASATADRKASGARPWEAKA